jgi:hypothetical protein
MRIFDQHIANVLKHVACDQKVKADLVEEMKGHLEEIKREYLQQGWSEEEATTKAIEDFGSDELVGDQLQKELFPYSNELFFTIGIGMIVFAAGAYLHGMIEFSKHYPLWLSFMFFIGLFITVIGFYPAWVSSLKILINILLAISIPFIFQGVLIIDTVNRWYTGPLQVLAILLMMMIIAVVFLLILKFDAVESNSTLEKKRRRFFHVIHLAAGTVFFFNALISWVGILFVGITWYTMLPWIFFLAWVLFYWLQMKWCFRKKKLTSFLLGVMLVIVMIILFKYVRVFFFFS